MIKISIVIPALNEEKLLPECLASLRNQDYGGEYEIIVADNGSTDGTAGITRKFGAKVVSCPERRGVFYARQAGADAACGEIIAQADADTVYPRDWLQRIANQFASHPEAVAVSGRFIYGNSPWWAKFEYLLRNGVNRLTAALFARPLVVSGATFAFRRGAFLSMNGYRGLSYSPDQYGISSRLSKLGKVLYDKNLCVSTSSRSVQKPVFLLITDVLVHLNRWGVYLGKSSISALQEFSVKTPSRRIAARLFPVLVIFLVVTYGYFIPTSSVFGKVYYEDNPKEKVVALTFDDGPNEPYTSQILDILANHNIKATFFVIGKNVELYPETARRIIAEGHVVGNHSYSHNANHALTEYGAKDLERAQETIDNTVGIRPHLYCPPHGKKSPWELEAVKKGGLIEVTWSVSANDQHVLAFLGEPSPETFAREIVSRTHPGEIILLHDGYGTLHDTVKADKSLTVKALPLIIEQLQARGYRFVTVPELLNVPAYNEVLA
jgi:peptidoglycan/xylan/chitin deacetylase (PgdA/CDA1 family)